VMVTRVYPAVGPEAGEMPDSLGNGNSSYSYMVDGCTETPAPAALMTETGTVPSGFGGVMMVRRLSLTTCRSVPDFPPNSTSFAPKNPDPVMITTVPPVIGPPEGEIPVICGTEAADAGAANVGRRTITMQIITHDMAGRVMLSDPPPIWQVTMHGTTSGQMIMSAVIRQSLNITNVIPGKCMQELINKVENEVLAGSAPCRITMQEN